jgi:hypothetical protein
VLAVLIAVLAVLIAVLAGGTGVAEDMVVQVRGAEEAAVTLVLVEGREHRQAGDHHATCRLQTATREDSTRISAGSRSSRSINRKSHI